MRRAAHRSRRPGQRRHGGLVLTVGLVVLLLTASGCTPEETPGPVETLTADATTTAPTASAAPAPVLIPDGTAADNLPYFQQIVGSVWASPDAVRGAAYVDALTAAGFDRATMQLTSDTTTVGQPAESIQFSVAWRDGCLVGQVGPATGRPVSVVLPLLAGGRCLIGRTVSIDG